MSVFEAAQSSGRGVRDAGCGIVDTGCALSVVGERWWKDCLGWLADLNLAHLVVTGGANGMFNFSSGGTLVAPERHRFPTDIAGMAIFVAACVVPSDSLVLLLGRDFLESIGGVGDSAQTASCGAREPPTSARA